MKSFILLILIVGSNGLDWDPINNFRTTFLEYRSTAQNAIAAVEQIINTTKKEASVFLEILYRNHQILVNDPVQLSDKCSNKFVKRENLNSSLMVQMFQLEVPLNNRISDLKGRLSAINSNVNIYQDLADSKYLNCLVFNTSCEEVTKEWLENEIQSLSCAISPNCHSHSIRKKRSVCSPGQFRCPDGECIDSEYYCNGNCHCSGCTDEPSGCVRDCNEFRCKETFKCIYNSSKCDGVDDCGDGSDEEGCPPPVFTNANCSIDAGDFLCGTKKCINIGLVCDGQDDCGDGSDEGERCSDNVCPPECSRMGGVCLSGSEGPRCLYECPPGMFETSVGCSLGPEPTPATLEEVIEDTPRLTTRYAVRIKYLKMKIITELSKSLQEFVRCKKGEFTLLSKVIKFPSRMNSEPRNSTSQSSTTRP